jgi:hypothetical protein
MHLTEEQSQSLLRRFGRCHRCGSNRPTVGAAIEADASGTKYVARLSCTDCGTIQIEEPLVRGRTGDE